MTNIKGAIFDVDGTLLDSMPIWDTVAADFLRSRGVKPRPELYDSLRPLGGHQIPAYFRAEYGIEETESEIRGAIDGLLRDFYFNIAPLKDGIKDVLDTFCAQGIKMCVATATERKLIEPALRRCGILDYFGRLFTCGEENTSKTAPDIYLRAAAFLGTGITETIVFEDALHAVKTAKNAGFIVAGIYDKSADARQAEIKSVCDYYFGKGERIFIEV